MAEQGASKKTRGRQRIPIKPIAGNEPRLVTFSKRKSGIYKKATELSNLCGAEVGVVIFSPAGKAFAFGSPSIEKVTDRFLQRAGLPLDQVSRIVEAHRKVRLEKLCNRHNELVERLQAAKDKNAYLKRVRDAVRRGNLANNVKPEWFDKSVEESSHRELADVERLYDALCNYLAEN